MLHFENLSTQNGGGEDSKNFVKASENETIINYIAMHVMYDNLCVPEFYLSRNEDNGLKDFCQAFVCSCTFLLISHYHDKYQLVWLVTLSKPQIKLWAYTEMMILCSACTLVPVNKLLVFFLAFWFSLRTVIVSVMPDIFPALQMKSFQQLRLTLYFDRTLRDTRFSSRWMR